MSKPVVEPVEGEDRCPECQGRRVLPKRKYIIDRKGFNLSDLKDVYDAILWDDDGAAWVWCPVCGGSGRATDAMERLMVGKLTLKP